jgi:hypothetical protein
MKTIVDMSTGEIYNIPNYCICEPTFVKKLEENPSMVGEILNVILSKINLYLLA